jgi:hypothetical protein
MQTLHGQGLRHVVKALRHWLLWQSLAIPGDIGNGITNQR